MENNERFPGNDIHHTAVIGPNVYMGTGNYIGPYCVIGFPGEHREKWGKDEGVSIGNNNTFTGHVTIDAGIDRPTGVMNNTFLMKHSHVGHDAIICSRATISCGAKIGGHTYIGKDVNVGLNAIIHQNHTIIDWCMIAMGAVVTLKCQTREGYMYAGNPATEKGPNKKAPKYLFSEGELAGSIVKCRCTTSIEQHLASVKLIPEIKESETCLPGSYQTGVILPTCHPYATAPNRVKLPISVIDTKQVELGIDNPEEAELMGYFDVDHIIVVREAHDDSLGHSPINAEATMIHLTSGDTFFIPMHIDEVQGLIDNVDKQNT
ncbi:hypothetical protein AB6805_30575 [Chitinophaga sp. RCC_12]|uniref:hypothetical protein n=1 Tax=Chitinophaga sp. RCC_12 TaxID=3239226 RepID=UPI0035242D40